MSRNKSSRSSAVNQDSSDLSSLTLPSDSQLDKTEAMFVRLTKLVTDSFATCIQKLTSSIDEKFQVKLDAQAAENFTLSNRVTQLERKVEALASVNADYLSKINSLSLEKKQLAQSIDNLDQYSRSDSLLIHGPPLRIGWEPVHRHTSCPE